MTEYRPLPRAAEEELLSTYFHDLSKYAGPSWHHAATLKQWHHDMSSNLLHQYSVEPTVVQRAVAALTPLTLIMLQAKCSPGEIRKALGACQPRSLCRPPAAAEYPLFCLIGTHGRTHYQDRGYDPDAFTPAILLTLAANLAGLTTPWHATGS